MEARGMTAVQPFLMFRGNAEEAMRFYVEVFDNAEINELHKYGTDQSQQKGTIQKGVFTIYGQTFYCTDSVIEHAFTFTPSISLFVTFDTEAELDRAVTALMKDGEVLMPLDQYPFSEKFTWLNDKFGVSWQLSL